MKFQLRPVVGRVTLVTCLVALASPAHAATYMPLRDASFTAPYGPVLSADGRILAFSATLVATGTTQAFVLDRKRGRVEVVSARRNDPSTPAAVHDVSGNGRFILFGSRDAKTGRDTLFMRDRIRRTTREIPIAPSEDGAKMSLDKVAISGDGVTVAFAITRAGKRAVYAYSAASRRVTPVSTDSAGVLRDGAAPDVSDNGRYVVFQSVEPLVSSAPAGDQQVYVRDLLGGTTLWVSSDVGVDPTGVAVWTQTGPPSIDGNGQFVSYVAREQVKLVGPGRTSLVIKNLGTGSVFTLGSATVVPEDTYGRVALAEYGGWAFFVGRQLGDAYVAVFRQSLRDGKIERVVEPPGPSCSTGTPCTVVAFSRLAPSGDGDTLAFETSASRVAALERDVYVRS